MAAYKRLKEHDRTSAARPAEEMASDGFAADCERMIEIISAGGKRRLRKVLSEAKAADVARPLMICRFLAERGILADRTEGFDHYLILKGAVDVAKAEMRSVLDAFRSRSRKEPPREAPGAEQRRDGMSMFMPEGKPMSLAEVVQFSRKGHRTASSILRDGCQDGSVISEKMFGKAYFWRAGMSRDQAVEILVGKGVIPCDQKHAEKALIGLLDGGAPIHWKRLGKATGLPERHSADVAEALLQQGLARWQGDWLVSSGNVLSIRQAMAAPDSTARALLLVGGNLKSFTKQDVLSFGSQIGIDSPALLESRLQGLRAGDQVEELPDGRYRLTAKGKYLLKAVRQLPGMVAAEIGVRLAIQKHSTVERNPGAKPRPEIADIPVRPSMV